MILPLEYTEDEPQPDSEMILMLRNTTSSIVHTPWDGFCQTEIGLPSGRILSITISSKSIPDKSPDVVPPEGYWEMQRPPLSSLDGSVFFVG